MTYGVDPPVGWVLATDNQLGDQTGDIYTDRSVAIQDLMSLRLSLPRAERGERWKLYALHEVADDDLYSWSHSSPHVPPPFAYTSKSAARAMRPAGHVLWRKLNVPNGKWEPDAVTEA